MPSTTKILELTSQCVMCGICIPNCPTYQQTLDENDSPRGRISLIQALALNKISYTKSLKNHLDSCLQCLTCQSICPSQVKYAEIITSSQNRCKPSLLERIYNAILTHNMLRTRVIFIINLLNYTHILPSLKRLAFKLNIKSIAMLPSKKIKSYKNKQKLKKPAKIIFFSGCATSLFDSLAVNHTIKLFKQLKISNIQIDNMHCCGALYKKQTNQVQRSQTINKLNNQNYTGKLLISLNSACSAYMIKSSQYRNYTTKDIIDYLSHDVWENLARIKFKAYHKSIFFHQSCTMKNQLNSHNDCLKLLNLIPAIEIKTLPSLSCCGASGQYLLSHSIMADKIATPVVQFIIKENIHYFISSDISCSLHIKQQLEKHHHTIEVLHPISLLYRQLDN